jgi:circadian clock protein KaiB
MKSRAALANLTMIGQEYTQGQYRVQVVDLIKNPLLAEGNQILAVPALIRELPIPMRQIIGDLSRQEHILVGINLYPASLAE